MLGTGEGTGVEPERLGEELAVGGRVGVGVGCGDRRVRGVAERGPERPERVGTAAKPAGASVVLLVEVPCGTSASPSVWRCAVSRSAIRAAPSASGTVFTPATKTELSPPAELPVSGSRSAMPAASAASKSAIQAASASSTSRRSDGTAFGSGFGPSTTRSAIAFPTTGPIVSPRRRPHATHRSGRSVVCAARVHGCARVGTSANFGAASPDPAFVGRVAIAIPRGAFGKMSRDELARRVLVP